MDNSVIASREYDLVDESGVKSSFKIFLFKPIFVIDEWCCKAEVHERENIWAHEVKGIDSMQSINLAIMTLKTEVLSFQKKYKGGFLFLDQSEEIWL